MLASEIIDGVAEVLQDDGNVTWTAPQLLAWLNDAQRAVAGLRADASTVTGNVALAAGTRQVLPAVGLRLLDVIRNMGINGATPGRAINQVSRSDLDNYNPDWHAANTATVVKEFVFDERDGDVFYVNPPADGTSEIEVLYTVTPAECTAASDEIALNDNYAPAMTEWMLYRCFARDSAQTPNGFRADRHFRNFFNLLGVKLQEDLRVSPKRQGNKP